MKNNIYQIIPFVIICSFSAQLQANNESEATFIASHEVRGTITATYGISLQNLDSKQFTHNKNFLQEIAQFTGQSESYVIECLSAGIKKPLLISHSKSKIDKLAEILKKVNKSFRITRIEKNSARNEIDLITITNYTVNYTVSLDNFDSKKFINDINFLKKVAEFTNQPESYIIECLTIGIKKPLFISHNKSKIDELEEMLKIVDKSFVTTKIENLTVENDLVPSGSYTIIPASS